MRAPFYTLAAVFWVLLVLKLIGVLLIPWWMVFIPMMLSGALLISLAVFFVWVGYVFGPKGR